MSKVGVEGFSTSDGEKHGPKNQEPDQPVNRQKRDAGPDECLQPVTLGSVPNQAAAMAKNQRVVIWMKNAATLAVPRDCTANRASRISTVSGTT